MAAPAAKGAKGASTGASKVKKTIGSQRWKMYESGSAKVKNKECPKCGDSNFLAEHKNRRTCGKCGYTEFKNKE